MDVRWQVGRSAAAALAMLALLVLALVTMPVPFVAVGRGPTFDTLGELNGSPVVTVADVPTFPTSGHLNMTTVGVTSGLTGVQALGLWWASDRQLIPRSAVVRPGESDDEAAARNAQLFSESQTAAKGAAITYLNLPATVYVEELTPQSPVAGALEKGDVLLAIDGQPIDGLPRLRAVMAETRPGQRVVVQERRGDAPPRDVPITLGELPGADQHGMLGIIAAARPVRDDQITISLGDVGGPSAGLIFALAIVDKLTPGEITGGRFVAGTGAIHSTGEVSQIQGIRFKMAAARDAGATVFLVPADNCEEARDFGPEGLQTVRVADLAGAVAALDTLRAGGTPPTC
jgi:PDZ domain-containing protein